MTEEDRLLHDLGRLARGERENEQDSLDERWDRLAAGTLTAEEEAELTALAETSPEAREALEAFRPLGADFQARVVEAVAAERRSAAEREEGTREPRPRPSVPRRSAGRSRWWWMVPAAAAAAALFLFVRGPSTLSPMPTYMADELTGGIKRLRGGEPGATTDLPVFEPGGHLTLVVRAQPPTAGRPVDARAFLASGAKIDPWATKPEVAKDGNVRLEEKLPNDLEPGAWRVWLVVGWQSKIPPEEELLSELRAGRTRADYWQAVAKDFRVEAQAPP